jgi:hypothetical protein
MYIRTSPIGWHYTTYLLFFFYLCLSPDKIRPSSAQLKKNTHTKRQKRPQYMAFRFTLSPEICLKY